MSTPVPVAVTVNFRGRDVPLASVSDQRVVSALTEMGRNVGGLLAPVRCPVHRKAPSDVRLHVDATGNADIRYESCCTKLRDAIGKALG